MRECASLLLIVALLGAVYFAFGAIALCLGIAAVAGLALYADSREGM